MKTMPSESLCPLVCSNQLIWYVNRSSGCRCKAVRKATYWDLILAKSDSVRENNRVKLSNVSLSRDVVISPVCRRSRSYPLLFDFSVQTAMRSHLVVFRYRKTISRVSVGCNLEPTRKARFCGLSRLVWDGGCETRWLFTKFLFVLSTEVLLLALFSYWSNVVVS